MTDDRETVLALLRQTRWVEPADLCEALVAEGALVRLGTGQWSHGEGDEDTGVMVVVQGSVDLYCQAPGDREVRVGHAGPGAALGQSMRFGGGPRIVTAICAEPSLLLRVSDAALDRIARTRPEIWRAVAGLVYLQLRGAVQANAEAVALPPRQRLAARLLALGRNRAGRAELRLTQQALAEMVGLTRKTANLYLAQFQREGLVSLDYSRIRLIDLVGLQRAADA